ncbi:MAG: ribosome-associated protein [Pseudoalteromonas tetraodonis]|jgi:ribosome-associated protein|uniref:Dual-action ribosomal maturation protein DarP n=5 Tax=Pseudoalteromonas TaxID=53246 RepID=A0A9W4QWD3_PSEHA|nr:MULTISPECIES: ribosome biogenesis factor YjgA [Pseudoalteromonas]ADT67231.1 ABC transporter ATP-binding protein [Pseudoalteromonas sp. SM9913]ALQ53603.1 ABC transporter ATP-binding protein [Pseudoalteromonas issachenkonii]ATC89354.1 ribosome-associated protein [Pseudoalteromonas issachenkonii]ATD01872.1 ribosome-associated protein [Pseudoalteromonas tetraodonis]EWS98420.1 ABC transporter ATP-binding protein [Pseudoalteromonas sp. SCSIO_11900]|tara:strand:- start:3948 stop:4472 length:525 start_codon:yes stop_codon:yes gene_type:complete
MAKKKGKPAEIEEEIIYVSKSELKREAQEFHQLGSEIAKMGKKQRERLPLNDDLKEAMVVADKISNKSDAYRRHLNYIAKTLRTVENIEEIKAIIDVMLNKNNQAEVMIKKIEQLRSDLIEQGDDLINETIEQYPALERQKMRQMVRNAAKEVKAEKPARSYKELFQYLKDAIM